MPQAGAYGRPFLGRLLPLHRGLPPRCRAAGRSSVAGRICRVLEV
jgi:hypothetical protein